ncbi:MAG: GNAT family N-acetyltransferase [Bacteroidota bacterium]
MLVRTYTPADRQACIIIFKSNLPLYFDASELIYLENWLNAKDQGINAYPNNLAEFFYVLEIKGQVLACGGFYIPNDEKRANMVWGMVKNAWHKKGLGKHLLLHRISVIQQEFPGFKTSLDTSQHTYQFFEKLGFSVLKITENSYGEGLHRYDMLL